MSNNTDILFFKRTATVNAAENIPGVKPYDRLDIDRMMTACGVTSTTSLAEWVASLEAHCDAPVVDDRKQEKLDKLKKLFPFYFE